MIIDIIKRGVSEMFERSRGNRSERTPLLGLESTQQGSLRQYAADAIVGWDRCLAASNSALIYPGCFIGAALAYPKLAVQLYKPVYTYSLIAGLVELGLDLAVARKVAIRIANHEIDAQKVKHLSNASKTIMNTFYFSLVYIIALYLVCDELVHHIGDNRVDTSNRDYGLGFLMPSLILGIAHALLELTKSRWANSARRAATVASLLYDVNRTITYAGIFNTIALPLDAAFHLSETGNVNPFTRAGLFLGAFFLGLLAVIFIKRYPGKAIATERALDTAATVAYSTRLFGSSSRQILERNGTALMALGLAMLNFIAFISAYAVKAEPVQRYTLHPNAASINAAENGEADQFPIYYDDNDNNDRDETWYFTAATTNSELDSTRLSLPSTRTNSPMLASPPSSPRFSLRSDSPILSSPLLHEFPVNTLPRTRSLP
jgi:hypothetical protein